MLRLSLWIGYACVLPGLLAGALVALLGPAMHQTVEEGLH